MLNSIVRDTKIGNTFEFMPNGTLVPSVSIDNNNIEYTIGLSPNNRIIYIGTRDKKFTINGLKINSPLPKSYFDGIFGYIIGWGYYKKIDSGWYAGFDFQTKPNEESKIQWFFQFDFDN